MESKNFILIFIGIIFVLAVLFIILGNRFELTKDLHYNLIGSKINKISINKEKVQVKINNGEWCIPQEITLDANNIEKPIRDRIIGWDIDECCVREIFGYDCALNKEVTLKYCYTANIGGEIKYATVEGYYLSDPLYYKIVLENLDKSNIQNKKCDDSIYPSALK